MFDKSFYNKMLTRFAHEVNNPLMIIQNYISLLIDDIDQGENPLQLSRESDHYDSLHEIAEQCQRIAKITKNVQDISRSNSILPQNHDLHPVISSAISLLEPMIVKSQIQLKWDASEEPCQGFIKFGEIKQVFLNVLDNAIYALNQKYHGKPSPQKNVIRIRIYHETRDHAGIQKPFIVVAIRDDGIGIQEKNRIQIFDPFFSTKKAKWDVPEHDKAQGMGLGLTYCQFVINQHGGFILFESERNKFTEFFIYLPCTSQDKTPKAEDVEVVF